MKTIFDHSMLTVITSLRNNRKENMQLNKRPGQFKLWMISSVCSLTIGLAIGSFGILRSDAFQAPQPAAATANPQERGIDANLYMQTSAEYAAVCLQTYNWAL